MSGRAWMQGLGMVVIVVGLSGCGGGGGLNKPTGTVAGKVTLKGEPLKSGSVVFFGENDGDTAVGPLQSDGTYTLKYGTGFSVPVGDYRVAIVPGPPPGAAAPDPAELMKTVQKPVLTSNISDKYRDPKTSGLIAVIKAGSNADTNFELK